MTINAIPTWHGGVKFRSQLEARWSDMFDLMGILWEYEPSGYTFDGKMPYLPDFHLPEHNCFVEIKPDRLYKCAANDHELVRLMTIDELWNHTENKLQPIYIIAGNPATAKVYIDYEWCEVVSCRRCGALSYAGFSMHGDIGTHQDCGCEKESLKCAPYTTNAMMAGEKQYDHR